MTMPSQNAYSMNWKYWVNVPIHIAGSIVVPNLSPDQKTSVHNVTRAIVKSTKNT